MNNENLSVRQHTKQQTFDIVLAHARKQRVRCHDKNDYICLYRNDEGLACFGGCLIPDELYSPDMEGGIVTNDFLNLSQDSFLVTTVIKNEGHDVGLVGKLQKIHDSNDESLWEYEFRRLAADERLEYAAPAAA